MVVGGGKERSKKAREKVSGKARREKTARGSLDREAPSDTFLISGIEREVRGKNVENLYRSLD